MLGTVLCPPRQVDPDTGRAYISAVDVAAAAARAAGAATPEQSSAADAAALLSRYSVCRAVAVSGLTGAIMQGTTQVGRGGVCQAGPRPAKGGGRLRRRAVLTSTSHTELLLGVPRVMLFRRRVQSAETQFSAVLAS